MKAKYNEMNVVFENIDVYYHEAAKRMGLSDAEFILLYILVQADGFIPQKRIYQETCKSKSTINSAIKKLENNGIVEIKALDGKSTQVRLTKEGKKLSQNTVVKVIEIENRIYDSWSNEQKELMLYLNKDFLDKFSAEVERL